MFTLPVTSVSDLLTIIAAKEYQRNMSKTAIANRDGMKVETSTVTFDGLYDDVPGGGFENVTARDVAIPYIRILQAISGEVKKGPGKIPGAEEGDIFNSGSGEFVKGDVGITAIPCAFQKKWIQRGPRGADSKPGPYIATLDKEPTGRKEGRSIFLGNGDEVSDVSDHYVVVVGDTIWQKALIRMASTQLKHSRYWIGLMQGIQWERGGQRVVPPMFSHSYHLTTGVETKDENSWSVWSIGKPVKIDNVQLAMFAKAFYQSVMAGAVKVADPVDDEATTAEVKSDDIPF